MASWSVILQICRPHAQIASRLHAPCILIVIATGLLLHLLILVAVQKSTGNKDLTGSENIQKTKTQSEHVPGGELHGNRPHPSWGPI